MSGYGTSSGGSGPLFGSVQFGRAPESTPLMRYGPNGDPRPSNGGGGRSRLGGYLNMQRIIVALAIFWVATVVYLANIGNSILRGMADTEQAHMMASSETVHNYRAKQRVDTPILGASYDSSISSSNGIPSSVAASDSVVTDGTTQSNAALTYSSGSSGSSGSSSSSSSNYNSRNNNQQLSNVTIMVVYGPEYHHYISSFAWTVAEGVLSAFRSNRNSGITGQVNFGTTDNLTFWDVLNADAIIIGSPVYNGNTHPYVQQWINNWHIEADLSRKVGSAFATAGGLHAGADGTLMSLLRSMMVFRMMAVGGDSWDSPYGAAATVHEEPFGDQVTTGDFASSCYENLHGYSIHPHFLRKAYGLGERVANVTFALAQSTSWMKDKPSVARFTPSSNYNSGSSSYGNYGG